LATPSTCGYKYDLAMPRARAPLRAARRRRAVEIVGDGILDQRLQRRIVEDLPPRMSASVAACTGSSTNLYCGGFASPGRA
jgi:hypothetical protein